MKTLRDMTVILVTLVAAAGSYAQADKPDLTFEAGKAGEAPIGWRVPTLGYLATVSAERPQQGKLCARINPDGKAEGKTKFGNLMTSIDATPYREKRVRLRAAVRVESAAGGRAQMWMCEDCEGNKIGFFDNMGDRPITDREWKQVEIVGDIGRNPVRLAFGIMVFGNAVVWFDDVSIEAVGEAKAGIVEPARALSDRGLANLVALTRLLGYLRYFHPSDEAAATDWPEFAIRAIREVESASSAEELAGKLKELVTPIAPTVRVFPLSKRPEAARVAPQKPPGESAVITMWRHRGVGMNQATAQIYSSTRTRASANDGKIPDGFADSAEPYFADLGGGVGCLVPIALYTDDDGTLPHATRAAAGKQPEASATVAPTPRYSGEDRATRLADVALGWNIFQHFYPYFDVVKTDWATVLPQTLKRAALDKGEATFTDTLRWMVAQLHDGHGSVTVASAADRAMPPLLLGWVEGKIVVTQVGESARTLSPMLKPGAIVKQIDGRPAEQVFADAQALVSSPTPQWLHYRALLTMLVGPADTPVTLELADPDGKSESLKLERSGGLMMLREPRPEKMAEIKPGIWYADLDRLKEGDLDDATTQKLAAAKGVIFDMRGYPASGGAWKVLGLVTNQTITCAQWHIPNQTRPDRTDMKFDFSNWPVQPLEPHIKGKVAFLTDGRAISAAETFMEIVEHNKLGEIVGGPTAGTNGNINPFVLPGGYHVSWTGMKVLKHDGSQHHGVGIRPTVPVERTIKGIAAGQDEVFERAIEIVSKP